MSVELSEASTTKRKRSKNFNELETRTLIDLVVKYIEVIENKKTNAVTWKEKEKVWQQISSECRALSGIDRSAAVLRSKYDSLKHGLKSKMTKNKMEIFKTGGGRARLDKLTDYEEKMLSYLQINVEGVCCPFNSDCEIASVSSNTTSNKETINIQEQPQEPSDAIIIDFIEQSENLAENSK